MSENGALSDHIAQPIASAITMLHFIGCVTVSEVICRRKP